MSIGNASLRVINEQESEYLLPILNATECQAGREDSARVAPANNLFFF